MTFSNEMKRIALTAIGASIAAAATTLIAATVLIYANRTALIDYAVKHVPVSSSEGGRIEVRSSISEESDVIKVIDRVNPAVVSIVITKDVPVVEQYFEDLSPFGDSFFDPFGQGFRFQIPRLRENGTEKKEVGGGSGFFVSKDGLIVTNRHVVEDEDAEYTVFTNDGKKHSVSVLARDPVLDIAVLKVDSKDTPYLTFADSKNVQLGQTAIAIGNALGEFRNSVSVGVVSGLSRSIVAGDGFGRTERLEEVIQTDAAINPGNSGGPLIGLDGTVIGMNVAMSSGAENIGFALPADVVRQVVDAVREHGEIVYPFLGVRYIPITPELKEKNRLSVDYGALVIRGASSDEIAVSPGSPADKAGIVENDVILEVDGSRIDEEKSLAALIRQKRVGQTISLKLLSKGQEKTVSVTLEKMP